MKDAVWLLRERLLILRCQGGDEAALRELIGQYSPGLRMFLRKVIGDEASADDLLQETWFDVYRKINGLLRPEAFPVWLYRIARDKANRARRRRPRADLPADANVREAVATEDEPFPPEEAEQVRSALDDLPEEQREVLVLRFVEEMSYQQIADVIARPLGTVRSRIHYAKLALRAKLESRTVRKEVPSCVKKT